MRAWVIDAVILITLAGALVYAPFGILIWYLGRKKKANKGHWIYTGNDDEWFGEIYKCSICNGLMIDGSMYCPECGAKMENFLDEEPGQQEEKE